MSQRFSRRLGSFRNDPPITVREDAPPGLRTVISAYVEAFDVSNVALLKRIQKILGVQESSLYGGRYGTSSKRIANALEKCAWDHVYDIIEETYQQLVDRNLITNRFGQAEQFADTINEYFRRQGIGYQLVDGAIQHRGDDASEQAVRQALEETERSGLDIAHREIAEALEDLSKRPQPDLTGAITHSITALEIVAREVASDQNATLGKILNDNPDMFPKPLNQSVEKMWGYASQYGRHVSEGKEPTYDEAELVVHHSAAAATYLVRKSGLIDRDTP